MKHSHLTAAALLAMGMALATQSIARNTLHTYPIKDVLQSKLAKDDIRPEIRLYFAGQTHPGVSKSFGTFVSNKKANSAFKSDKAACERAFVSAILSLQDRARREGGNAIIDIQSDYKSHLFSSATHYRCGAGAIIAGVALKGTIIKLKQ